MDKIRPGLEMTITLTNLYSFRLLRELAAGGKASGDTTTLEDFSVLEKLREDDE
jgi:acetyl-CoA synthetase